MASHGVSRHGRYERFFRKHRLETRENGDHKLTLDGEVVVHKQQTQANNLHDDWVAMHEKRQQVDNPSTTVVATNPQTSTADSDPVPTATEIAASDSYPTIGAPSATDSDAAPTAGTAATTVTTTVSWSPSDPTADSAVAKTTVTNFPEAAIVTSALSDESATESASETSTATTEAPTESATNVLSVTGSLSEVGGMIATLTPEDDTSTSTEESPDFTSTSSKTAPATTSTSVPIISQSSEPDESPIALGSSIDLPTAMVAPETTPTTQTASTSSQIIAGIVSESSSSTNTSTDSSTTTTTATTTTSFPTSITSTTTTTTSSTSTTTQSDSPSQSGGYSGSGYGWGDDDSPGDSSGDTSDPTTAASPDSTTLSGSGSGSMTPQTTGKIVGGVVGGVAGATIIFLLIFLLLRRRRKTGFFFGSPARSIAGDGGGGLIREPSTRQMVSRDSNKESMFGAAYFAPAFMKRWRQSEHSTGEESFMSSSPTERGFQKVSGRKLPSGIQPGFEYSSGGLEAGSPTESDFSPTLPPVIPRSPFSQPPPSNPFSQPLDASVTREVREDNRPVMRPSPARIPTSGSANATWAEASARAMPMSFPMPPSNPVAIPKRPDALGRSHPSYDGSRGSRFSENL
ncbi:hypothetical protein BDV12DRAFT_168755 [Aspergillus spectabilis]